MCSRRPPPKEMMDLLPQGQRDRVEHVACDFLSKPEDIAKQLQEKNVSADYIFFYSYAQPKPKPGQAVSTYKFANRGYELMHRRLGQMLRSFLIRTVSAFDRNGLYRSQANKHSRAAAELFGSSRSGRNCKAIFKAKGKLFIDTHSPVGPKTLRPPDRSEELWRPHGAS